jgi:hypothetical protein
MMQFAKLDTLFIRQSAGPLHKLSLRGGPTGRADMAISTPQTLHTLLCDDLQGHIRNDIEDNNNDFVKP